MKIFVVVHVFLYVVGVILRLHTLGKSDPWPRVNLTRPAVVVFGMLISAALAGWGIYALTRGA